MMIGARGELLVFEYEKNKLIKRGQNSDSVIHISMTDDSKGYDIESLDQNENKVYIEVKSTVFGKSNNSFYLTTNELEKSKELTNYHLYRVFHTLSEYPIIKELKEPNFLEDFNMRALLYKVTEVNPD